MILVTGFSCPVTTSFGQVLAAAGQDQRVRGEPSGQKPSGGHDGAVRRVVHLLGKNDPAEVKRLIARLEASRDKTAHQILLQAMLQVERRPPSALVSMLLKQLDWYVQWPLQEREDVGRALGRCLSNSTAQKAVSVVLAHDCPFAQRVLIIEALANYHDPKSVTTLVRLTASVESPQIREAAMHALTRLTGNDLGDAHAWQRWHYHRRRLPVRAWYRLLIEDRARQERRMDVEFRDGLAGALRGLESTKKQLNVVLAMLVDTRRRLFRTTDEKDRQALLVSWLGDERVVTRELAIELTEQRLTANRPFGDDLRAALRQCLDDVAAELRRQSTLLLYHLADEAAAVAVSERLVAEKEDDPEVRKAYLLLLARCPQKSAVEPALEMLSDSVLSGPAAGALAAAIDQQQLTPQQKAHAARHVRRLVQARSPEPLVVALLARVANEEDWQRIARWMDAPDARIKEAATRAWAESRQPLWELAKRTGDEYIRPILYGAAAQRGTDARTMQVLAEHRPSNDQNLDAWRRAMVAMAQRVPVKAIVFVDKALTGQVEDELRHQILTEALGRLLHGSKESRPETRSESDQRVLVELLLRRAQIRLDQGESRAAVADFLKVEAMQGLPVDETYQDLVNLGLLRAYLTLADAEQATRRASLLLGPQHGVDRLQMTRQVGLAFIEAAQRSLTSGRVARARQLIERLGQLLGPKPSVELANLIDRLDRRILNSVESGKNPTPGIETHTETKAVDGP